MNDLTKQETIRYEVLKGQVKNGLDSWMNVGNALLEIRDSKLYREEYETFEEFCKEEYGFEVRKAYKIMEATETMTSLNGSSHAHKITNQAQAQALATVPTEKRGTVLGAVVSGGKITAATITTAAKTTNVPKLAQKTVELDKTGFPIPEAILEDWKLSEEIGREFLSHASRIKVHLEKAKENDEPAFREVSNTAVTHAMNLYTALKQIVPYAVCTSCQGHNPKKCTLCKGRGFFSQFLFQNAIPAEMKAIRQKAIERKK